MCSHLLNQLFIFIVTPLLTDLYVYFWLLDTFLEVEWLSQRGCIYTVLKLLDNFIFYFSELHLATTWPHLTEGIIVDNDVYS